MMIRLRLRPRHPHYLFRDAIRFLFMHVVRYTDRKLALQWLSTYSFLLTLRTVPATQRMRAAGALALEEAASVWQYRIQAVRNPLPLTAHDTHFHRYRPATFIVPVKKYFGSGAPGHLV